MDYGYIRESLSICLYNIYPHLQNGRTRSEGINESLIQRKHDSDDDDEDNDDNDDYDD